MNVELAFRCGRAYAMGRAFRAGFRYARGIALDADKEDVTFRTAKNGSVIAIKDGDVVGGAGTSVGPDKLPTFSSFCSTEAAAGKKFTAQVRMYAQQYLKPVIESLRYPGGMPDDCERIVMGPAQIRELASHMNSDKAKVLPFIAEVYRTGSYRQVPDLKHKDSVEAVVYTTGRVTTEDGETFTVELVSKKLRGASRKAGFIQYGISKADPVSQDSAFQVQYGLVEVLVKK